MTHRTINAKGASGSSTRLSMRGEVATWSTPRRPSDIAKRIREAVKECDRSLGAPNPRDSNQANEHERQTSHL